MYSAGKIGKISPYLADITWWESMLKRAYRLVEAYHQKHSDLPGLPLDELRQGVIHDLPDPAVFDALIGCLQKRGTSQHGTYLAVDSFTPTLEAEVRGAAEKIRPDQELFNHFVTF